MIHINEVTNNGMVHVCISVYHVLLKRNSPARTCPSVKINCSSHKKKPLYSTTLKIQAVSYHVTSERKVTSTTYAAAQATLDHTWMLPSP